MQKWKESSSRVENGVKEGRNGCKKQERWDRFCIRMSFGNACHFDCSVSIFCNFPLAEENSTTLLTCFQSRQSLVKIQRRCTCAKSNEECANALTSCLEMKLDPDEEFVNSFGASFVPNIRKINKSSYFSWIISSPASACLLMISGPTIWFSFCSETSTLGRICWLAK